MEQGDVDKNLFLEESLGSLESPEYPVSSKTRQGLDDILYALVYGSQDAKMKAASEIQKLPNSTSKKKKAYLVASGVLQPLVSMLDRKSCPEFQESSMQALLSLALRNERIKMEIVKAGAIPPLVELMRSADATLRESATVVILTLSATDANKLVIGCSGVTPLLVDMLIYGSVQGKVDAVMALYNLSTHSENLGSILASGAISPLIWLLKECKKASKVAEKTTGILQSLTIFEDARSEIVAEGGGVLALVEVLEEGSIQGREHAVSALLAMCQCQSGRCKYRDAILQEGAIPGLLELTVQGTAGAKQKAQKLLKLLRNPPTASTSRSATASASASASAMLKSIVYDMTSHVDDGQSTAKKMLSEMVQLSMGQSMRHLHQTAMVSVSSRSNRFTDVPTK